MIVSLLFLVLFLSCFNLSLLCLSLSPLPDSYLLSLPSFACLTSPCSLLSFSSLACTPLPCLNLLFLPIVLPFVDPTSDELFLCRHNVFLMNLMMTATFLNSNLRILFSKKLNNESSIFVVVLTPRMSVYQNKPNRIMDFN